MNIFVVDPDPVVCARYLDDKRLNKMIVETAQMLSTAVRICYDNPQLLKIGSKNRTVYTVPSDIIVSHEVVDGELIQKILYLNTHENHPCTKWARETRGNYLWLLDYLEASLDEYSRRFQKVHATEKLLFHLRKARFIISAGDQTPFVNCTTDFKWVRNVHHAYRLQLDKKWRNDKNPKWSV